MRLIDADKLIMHLADFALSMSGKTEYSTILQCIKAVEEQPTVGPQKELHGRWIYYEGETIEDGGRCSVCECDQPMFIDDWEWKYIETDYCPHCGARMDAKMDEEG